MSILITGASGFIGGALCERLSTDNKVAGIYHRRKSAIHAKITWEQADITDFNLVSAICKKYSPDVVIHCAGIAHQKMGVVDCDTYMRVNSEATENFAKVAAKYNSNVRFIFLSSVSVYGEENLSMPVSEDSPCRSSSDYAVSKLNAERRLIALADKGIIRNLFILRLAPVYDRVWSLNLDRRVFAPKKLAYLRFGSGSQKMSALARPNLVDFISHIFQVAGKRGLDSRFRRNDKNRNLQIFNICDADPYEFNTIIRVFRKSGICANRPVISIPLFAVWFVTRIASVFFPKKKKWIRSCYDKLASDLIFDNGKMMSTGFSPRYSLKTIFYLRK